MATASTPIAPVQFARLTIEERAELAAAVFRTLEYDNTGEPGSSWDSDTTPAVAALFNAVGVNFTDPNDIPAAYRLNQHYRADGAWCRWSLCSVEEPNKRTTPGDIHCPERCPNSVVLVNPNGEEGL